MLTQAERKEIERLVEDVAAKRAMVVRCGASGSIRQYDIALADFHMSESILTRYLDAITEKTP